MNPLEFAELLNEVPDDMLRSANDYSCRRQTTVLRVCAGLTAAAAACTGIYSGVRWLEKQRYINRVPDSALSNLDPNCSRERAARTRPRRQHRRRPHTAR